MCDMCREESTCLRKCGTSQSARLAEYVAGSRRIHVREVKRIVFLPAHSAGYHIWHLNSDALVLFRKLARREGIPISHGYNAESYFGSNSGRRPLSLFV